MLLTIAILGIFLSAILIYFNLKKNPSVIYLGLFFFMLSIYSLTQYVLLYSDSVFFVSLFYINSSFITYLIGPLFYFYFRSIVTDNARLKLKDIIHFLPVLIALILAFDHIITPWTYKMDIAAQLINDHSVIYKVNHFLLSGFIPLSVLFLSRPVLVLIYITMSFVLLLRFTKHKANSQILTKYHFNLKWLSVLISLFFVLVLAYLMQIIQVPLVNNMVVFYTMNALQIISGIGLIGLLLSPFLFPDILYGLPHYHQSDFVNNSIQNHDLNNIGNFENNDEIEEQKKSFPEFDTNYLEHIEKIADECMNDLQPYLHTECNLFFLAKTLNIPAHHLSFYFKEIKKQSFNDFRNQWRVKHAKKLIEQNKNMDYTMEAIGMLSGFSSKNAFFSAFKKFEHTTPGDYAEKLNNI